MAKQKLVESFSVTSEDYRIQKFDESTSKIEIEEAGKKKNYKAEAVYTFPISRPGEKNLNERIYPTKLWEKVVKDWKNKSSFGLMDHPKDEGSAKDTFGVWRNLRFSEDKKLVLADCYLFGTWGRHIKEALEAGASVGFSSSGFGEFEEDGMTISSESYELERPADIVLNPSYSVYGTQEDSIEAKENKKEESIEKNIQEESKKEVKNMEKTKLNSFEEKSFRLNVQSRLKEIAKESISDQESQYEELLSYFEEGIAVDLRETVESLLENTKKEIKELAKTGATLNDRIEESKKELTEKIKNLQKENSRLEQESLTMTEKYNKATDLLDNMKAYSNKMKEMFDVALAEKNGMISATEYIETLAFVENLEEEKAELKKEVMELRAKNRKLRESIRVNRTVTERNFSQEKFEEEIEEEIQKVEDEVREEYTNIKPEILEYYNDLEYAQPEVKKIKSDILSAKTLIEAQRNYLRLKSLIFIEDHERRTMPTKSSHFFKEDTSRRIKDKVAESSFKPHHDGWV